MASTTDGGKGELCLGLKKMGHRVKKNESRTRKSKKMQCLSKLDLQNRRMKFLG